MANSLSCDLLVTCPYVTSGFRKALPGKFSIKRHLNTLISSANYMPERRLHAQLLSKATTTSRETEELDGPKDLLDHNGALRKDQPVARAELIKLKAVVAFRNDNCLRRADCLREIMLGALDSFNVNRSTLTSFISLQLVGNNMADARTMKPKLSKEAMFPLKSNGNSILYARSRRSINHEVEFVVESNFGIPGAILVTNKGERELFLESITIEGIAHFACNSWVQPDKVNDEKRIFFCNKVYLPNNTPEGLEELREEELRRLRGDGKGMRLVSDRIYDYDVYNDLGDPDKGVEFKRPTLSGDENPHPRRCRTGRPPANADVKAESRVEDHDKTPIYVPRDETLGDIKREAVDVAKLKGTLRNIMPSLLTQLSTESNARKGFSDIDGLYQEMPLVQSKLQKNGIIGKLPIARMLREIQGLAEEIFKFEPPKIVSGDTSGCLRDDDFGRQALAGINPMSIECLREFPVKSKLDPSLYGPQQSALKEEHIIGYLNGMSLKQALEEKKMFILDYHDTYLPFLDRINALEGRKAYATRTIFFLTPIGTLKPIAIELTLPSSDRNIPARRVLSPPVDATTNWLWQMAKAHVCSNDAGVHQLVHHWLRTHACMEPFIIAAHRQMSTMHPIFKFLEPHMRYTLKINAMARETLINAEGIIETDFTPARYCMLMSCAAYRDWWRFDLEGLPSDLIRRGMAVADASEPHGVKLLIEDYPYASDGLLIWSAIERLVQTYVNYYYPNSTTVQSDPELQAWYAESINVGHADLRDATWWPKLSTPSNLCSILSTLIWISSAQHAALNFGQYPYGGYVPSRPPLMRRLLPDETDPEYLAFVADPQGYFISALPSLFQAMKFMAVIDIISAHSPDEEYIGSRRDLSAWSGDPEIVEAFFKFSLEIKAIEKEIESRNADRRLKNRCGAGIAPYELLLPTSEPGVTGRGVPNSITV